MQMEIGAVAAARPQSGSAHRCILFLLLFLSLPSVSVDAAITSPLITLSLDAGATGTVDVSFTTATTIPVDGTIVVTFASTFYVDCTALTNVAGFDLSSTVVAVPASAQATIMIATTDAVAGNLAFTLDGISNPGMGTTSSYSIRTTDVSGATLESTTVSGSTFASTPITNAVVTTSLPNAGATVAYTVAFTTDVTLRIGSVIMLQFPTLSNSKIVFAGASLTNRVNIDAASTTVQVASPYLRLTIAGQDVPAATAVSLTYSNIINPAAQPSGVFGVYTRHPTGAIFQGNSAVAGLTYLSTTLPSSATLTPASYFGGIVTTYTVQFAHAAYLPSGSRVQVTFPARFDISGATMTHLTNLPSVNTVLTLPGVNMAQVTLGNVAVVAGTGRQFTLDGIVNPGSSCDEYIVEYCTTTWETYTISITDSGGNLFEESTTVPGTPIVKKPLTYGRVRPVLKTPHTLTQATVMINTEAVIPIDGSIDVVFPADYSVNAASATASSLVGIPAASTAVIATGLEVSLTIAGASISPSSGLSITFSDITTPSIMAVGNFIVRTRDALGNIMEESLTIGGEGCTYVNDCNGHGTCTLLSKVCICDSGWGAPTDVTTYRSPDCSTRVCPSDFSWSDIPTDAATAHSTRKECSDMGICDRSTGLCSCFPGFEGATCQRMGCYNDCSDRGTCRSMSEIAAAKNAEPISAPTTYGGDPFGATWDVSRIFGCVCDSGWAVGTGDGEVQATEYFGADCSKRHCPIGNDPDTTADETDCVGQAAPGGFAVGVAGNLCLSECSNRGVCNYRTGTCNCFPGYTGFTCQISDALSK